MKPTQAPPSVRYVLNAWVAGVLLFALAELGSPAFPRYRDPTSGTGNCSTCHGAFDGPMSPKQTQFPSDSKHEMHRAKSSMDTDCDACHTTGDDHNPFIKSSNGITGVPGRGCTGCHNGVGLRAHHAANGFSCIGCHPGDANLTAPPENVPPPYYGTAISKVGNPCNDVAMPNRNENWSLGDFLGLDNDGNNVYDKLDPACSPYRILSIMVEGDDVRITWETVGGRTDVLTAADEVNGTYEEVGSPLAIPGTDIVSTNDVQVGGATGGTRFYQIKLIP